MKGKSGFGTKEHPDFFNGNSPKYVYREKIFAYSWWYTCKNINVTCDNIDKCKFLQINILIFIALDRPQDQQVGKYVRVLLSVPHSNKTMWDFHAIHSLNEVK